jgi:hypothetical protein
MDRRRERLARALEETGLWRSAEPAERRAQLHAIRSGHYPLDLAIFADVRFAANGRVLAEGGVGELLAEMAPALAEYGVRLQVRESARTERGYTVEINGLVCAIWNEPMLEYAATVRPLAVVNKILEAAGAPVRIFTLYAGDAEGLAYLLDPRVLDVLRASGLYDRRELPELAAV